jgi:hypothetical protein
LLANLKVPNRVHRKKLDPDPSLRKVSLTNTQGETVIIWGSKAKETKGKPGKFFCPGCLTETSYVPVKVSRYFTLYFVPLFPTETLAEHVRCGSCKGDFNKVVLSHSKEQILATLSPWKCASCNNLNPFDKSDCLACGTTRREPTGEGVPNQVEASSTSR